MKELELDILGNVMLGFHEIYSNVPTHDTLTNLQALNSLSKCKQVMLKDITFLGVLTLVVFAPLQSKEGSKHPNQAGHFSSYKEHVPSNLLSDASITNAQCGKAQTPCFSSIYLLLNSSIVSSLRLVSYSKTNTNLK